MTSPHTRIKIGDIVVGTRHRRDMGDIDGLAASIADLGLLHPIVVRPNGVLVAGERRLRAAELLGWTEIPVNIIDLDAVVRGEFAENSVRKNFTLSEAVAIKRALEPLEKVAARRRCRGTAPTASSSSTRPGPTKNATATPHTARCYRMPRPRLRTFANSPCSILPSGHKRFHFFESRQALTAYIAWLDGTADVVRLVRQPST